MNLVYVGNVQFEETEASGGLAVDPWGFDVLTREWAGAAYLLDGFLSTLGATVTGYDAAGNPIIIIMRGRRVRDTVYPQLFLTTISVSVERAFAKVSSSFRGVSDGRSALKPYKSSFRSSAINSASRAGSAASSPTRLRPQRSGIGPTSSRPAHATRAGFSSSGTPSKS